MCWQEKGNMGKLVEEKALVQSFYGQHHDHNNGDHQRQGLDRYNSLEEKVSEFLDNDYAESDATDGYGSDANESDDSLHQHHLYWESQEALLQEILERYASVGSKLRNEINGIIEEARETQFCSCKNQMQMQKQSLRSDVGCISCLRNRVTHLLCRRGLDATLCVSKWKHTKNHPAGTHEYIEVIASTQGRKKQVPFVIELEFRDQFEIVKACDEYAKLVDKLPECYVGKSDYLNPIVGVMCDAAKRSMEELKLHMGPWRKRSFVQMKWSNSSERRSLVDEPSRPVLHQPCSKSSKIITTGIVSKRDIDTTC